MLKVGIIIGSPRPGRKAEAVARDPARFLPDPEGEAAV